ncbi:MAG: hypothetical protein ABJX46_13900, partial [Erythrobacter sp.]
MKKTLLLSTTATAVFAALTLQPTTAQADDCLLDRDNDGVVDETTDNDGGAESANVDARLACGVNAEATGPNSTAVGGEAEAS